ncbi:hypothetical protein SLH49_19920 [Cognatiyoonia sp. IB215446]|uniref:hypothetical protein n=1 Tax=Cognatiyoonia sp. IB215446 TaxID=3097355 RepID=UPI002A15A293|nr:hypothetical protein [Cognatiyoonia sp. IB215446]MDX8350266.1 hypothetical protein [Cognatiyoonia sp. IB215446]
MPRKTWSATDIANDVGESRDLVVRICMDCAVFLTGIVFWDGDDPRLNEDAFEELKEVVTKLRSEPSGIADYLAAEGVRTEL